MTFNSPPSIVEAARRMFERDWAAGKTPSIESVLPSATDPRFVATLEELVHLDLDFRWQRWAEECFAGTVNPEPPTVENYIQRFSVLRECETVLRLAKSEFEARRRAGLRPAVEDFERRFTEAGFVPGYDSKTMLVVPMERALFSQQRLTNELRQWLVPNAEAGTAATLIPGAAEGVHGDTIGDAPFTWSNTPKDIIPEFPGYQNVERIAEGGMGLIFKAWQTSLERNVALKMIRTGSHATSEELSRFRREAVAVARLQHPNIVQIYEIGILGKQPYFSMEFVEGGSLAQQLNGTPWPSECAARFLVDLSAAVAYAHARNIIHRDLKPGNILLARRSLLNAVSVPKSGFNVGEWIPKITDFGLAKQINSDQEALTNTEAVLGTPCYMAPEQASGQAALVGPASDVYALGAVLYELLVGRPPFKAATALETIRQVCSQEPVSPRQLNSATAQDLDTICIKCLFKEPSRRYHEAGELHDDLQRFLEGRPIRARRVGRIERWMQWARRNPWPISLATAMVFAIGLLGLALNLGQRTSQLESLSELSQQFDRQLSIPSLEPSYFRDMVRIAERLDELSSPVGQDAQNRLTKAFAERIEANILQPRLESESIVDIRSAIDSLSSRSTALSRSLREKLEQRLRLTIFEFRAGDDILKVFNKPLTVPSPDGVILPSVPTEISQQRDAISHHDSNGNVEMEATFASDWVNCRQLAILLNVPPGSELRNSGYRFELRTTTSEGGKQPTFAEARASSVKLQMAIIRDLQTVKLVNLDVGLLTASELRLLARRDGNSLLFQINETPPIVEDELFWSDLRNHGKFGLSWSDEVTLTSLRATRPSSSITTSAIERGDSLYSSGMFNEALASYELQYEQTNDTELRAELVYKRALCLFSVERGIEARVLLQPLIVGQGRWSQLAAIQVWLSLINESNFAEADAVFDGLTTRPDFVQLAAQMPLSTREKMLQRYRNSVDIYGLRYNPDRIRNLERALDLLIAVQAELWEISETRIQLIDAYDRADRLTEAREQAEYLLNHPDLSVEGRCRLLERMARILVRQGQVEVAQTLIDRALFSNSATVPPFHEPMLLTRAAVHGSRQQWELSEEDLRLYFDHQLEPVMRSDPRAWLLRGLVARRLDGNLNRAKSYWAEGYRLALECDYHDLFLTTALGLISETITIENHDQLLEAIKFGTGDGFESQAVGIIRKGLIPDSLIVSVLLNAAKRERTLDFLEQRQCHHLSAEELIVVPARIVACELFAQMILGPEPQSRELSADEDTLIWELTQTLYDAYVQGEFRESYLLLALWAWQGQKLIGWDALAAVTKPDCRGPLAYVFAHHFQHLGKSEAAADMMSTAAADAPPDSLLKSLVARRHKLPNLIAIDLQSVANQEVAVALPGVKPGELEVAGLRFQIATKMIQLAGVRDSDWPVRVDEIKVERQVAKLHFLHNMVMSETTLDGTEVGRFEIHFADGHREIVSLSQGNDLREDEADGTPQSSFSNSQNIWTGTNIAGQKLRLCATSWTNTRTKHPIASLSFVSALDAEGAVPFCVAITIEEGSVGEAVPTAAAN